MADDLPEDLVRRIQEVNNFVTQLDPAIRAGAFELFREFVLSGSKTLQAEVSGSGPEAVAGDIRSPSALEFFSQREGDKPSDNALIAAGYYYSMYGNQSFNTREIKEIAEDAGLLTPERLDKSFQTMKKEGKALFRQVQRGKGLFRPTVHGEAYFTKNLGIRRGRVPKQADEQPE